MKPITVHEFLTHLGKHPEAVHRLHRLYQTKSGVYWESAYLFYLENQDATFKELKKKDIAWVRKIRKELGF